ncbi:MAG: SDR family NAD(P)-dependent oxidoreductase [Verrucomicrobia bacterium]|nr:SDR family NAD(P)-dependent oxidoreductase [Verrucomicrobiota bacterium]
MSKPVSKQRQCVLVTGVSRGLGRAMVGELIRLGHTVAGAARTGSALDELRTAHPEPHRWSKVDVCSDREVADWAKHLASVGFVPDLLLNNAAVINANARLWEISEADFSRVIDTNVKGVANVLRHFLPAMIERGAGVVVNFSSGWGRSTAGEVAPYCATKWAIEGLTQALAQELPAGMCAVPLNPGVIDTDMLRSCFGKGAAHYPTPEVWARRAVPFLLALGPADNGSPLTAPGR